MGGRRLSLGVGRLTGEPGIWGTKSMIFLAHRIIVYTLFPVSKRGKEIDLKLECQSNQSLMEGYYPNTHRCGIVVVLADFPIFGHH